MSLTNSMDKDSEFINSLAPERLAIAYLVSGMVKVLGFFVELKAETMFYHGFKTRGSGTTALIKSEIEIPNSEIRSYSNPYSFNFLYKVATPIFNKLAASARLP